MNLLQIIIIASLWCNGLFIITGDGMILEKLDIFLKTYLFEIIYKPVIGCIACMASLHGIFWTWFFLPHTRELIWQVPLICICTAAMNMIINRFYE